MANHAEVNIAPEWKEVLSHEFGKEYFLELTKKVRKDYLAGPVFPHPKNIFRALDLVPPENVRVVILGQDPYHTPGVADGLAFSTLEDNPIPPSLKNIFKEIETDLGVPYPESGNLLRWSSQGVFLLNATLSVRAHAAGSHQKQGWEHFTDRVIQTISSEKEGVVFLLWGGYAKKKIKLINSSKHLILSSGHPSPLSANRGFWFGNKHFSQCNAYLKSKGKAAIDW